MAFSLVEALVKSSADIALVVFVFTPRGYVTEESLQAEAVAVAVVHIPIDRAIMKLN
jgi:3-deoxy-D-manno-octulosonic-acid transferase